MSENHNDGSSGQGPKISNWEHLRDKPAQPKGPQKPWDQEVEGAAGEFVGFLKDAENKKALQDFIVDAYKKFEAHKIEQMQARLENEKRVDSNKLAPFHDVGNVSPLMSDTFNMFDAEKAFARGLKATKANLVRSVEDRVEEINHLLSGLGGFSSQLKACFARSTVVFLEEEDPKHSFRERLIFSINLPSYELKRPWSNETPKAEEPEVEPKKVSKYKKASSSSKRPDPDADPRSPLQATWDDAVNALAQIIATSGLKPKYCKNDRHYGRFVMKQDLRSSANLPDEYFSLTLDYNTAERIKEMCEPYNKIVKDYEKRIAKLAKKLEGYSSDSVSARYVELKRKHLNLTQERDFFVGTTPDPNQLSEGLLFLIEVSTLKDYHIVKDRMQSIMTKYILHLSKLATKEAAVDPDLEYEMWKMGQKKDDAAAKAKGEAGLKFDPEREHWAAGLTAEDLASVPEYVVEEGTLKPLKKKAA